MRALIITSSIILMSSCAIQEQNNTPHDSVTQLTSNPADELQSKVLNEPTIDSNLTVTIDSTWIDPPSVIFDSSWIVIPPNPPYDPWPWPDPYPWIIDIGTVTWYLPDTLESHEYIPKHHFTSNRNCYQITPNESGALITMEVIYEETVECHFKQMDECVNDYPLSFSWFNAPIQMKKGYKSIQINYPKTNDFLINTELKTSYTKDHIQFFS
jgi:hypothetical protein